MKPERWHEVDKILQSVLERDPAERGAYLDQVCAGDEQLRHAVLTVMASYKEDGTFMASPVLEVSSDDFTDGPKLKQGDSIGSYRIRKPIGRGGMGEVYLADHTTLSREVALKILPEHFLDDAQRVQRFRQEARAVLALNHPNVVTVYDTGEAAGVHFISTEFVEGQTLRERMAHARLTVSEAIEIGTQVAGAIAYAHEKGVIHRDIKPENVMLRPDGYVKVLDFGIAKLTERQTASTTDPNEAQTRMKVETSPGMVMGTAHYMSPEQARGKKMDERTDTWSLGAVLYEMLTGRPPFEGETASDIIGLILQRDPAPLSALMPNAPAELERIVSKALDKSQDERYQTAKDFLADLRRFKRRYEHEADVERSMPPGDSTQVAAQVSTGGQQASATGAEETATSIAVVGHTTSSAEYIVTEFKRHRTGVLIAVALLVVAVAGIGFGLYRWTQNRKAADKSGPSFAAMKIMPLTDKGNAAGAVVSPDGRYVAYVCDNAGRTSLHLRQVTEPSDREIVPSAPDVVYSMLTFSPDGNAIYYASAETSTSTLPEMPGTNTQSTRDLYRVPLLGGAIQTLNHHVDSAITFAPDGKQFAFVRNNSKSNESAIIISDADGSRERQLTLHRAPELYWSLAWSPDGQTIAYDIFGTDKDGYFINIGEARVADGHESVISGARWRAMFGIAWLPDKSGIILNGRDRPSAPGTPPQLWRIAYPDGAAQRITNDLIDYEGVSLTNDGKALVTTKREVTSNIWIAPNGDSSRAHQFTSGKLNGAVGLAWSPDGRIVYTSLASGYADIWITSADGGTSKQLTFEKDANDYPTVSPDGRYIVFMTNRRVGWSLWRMNLDGSGLKELVPNINQMARPAISADSQWVFYSSSEGSGKNIGWRVSIEGGAPQQLSQRNIIDMFFSRDGTMIAFVYSEGTDSRRKIGIAPLSNIEQVKTLDAPRNGSVFDWSPDGLSLIYVKDQDSVSNLWSLPIDGGKPRQLTDWKSGKIYGYGWSPDRKQLAVARGNISNDVVLIRDSR